MRKNSVMDRKNLVEKLFEIGLSRKLIAQATGIKPGNITYDLKKLKEERVFGERIQDPTELLKIILEKYVEWGYRRKLNSDAEVFQLEEIPGKTAGQPQRESLGRLLQIQRVKDMLSGMIFAREALIRPQLPEKGEFSAPIFHKGYELLVRNILDTNKELGYTNHLVDNPEIASRFADEILSAFFAKVAQNDLDDFDLSGISLESDNFSYSLASIICLKEVNNFRDNLKPKFKDDIYAYVNHNLSTLTDRESDVLRFYFGINCHQRKSYEEIGLIFDLTRERVRQIKEKAIRRMRHTSRSALLRESLVYAVTQ
jgi:DNA-binding CsgD family transcriptional regulator